VCAFALCRAGRLLICCCGAVIDVVKELSEKKKNDRKEEEDRAAGDKSQWMSTAQLWTGGSVLDAAEAEVRFGELEVHLYNSTSLA
jgi:hypothetical protein